MPNLESAQNDFKHLTYATWLCSSRQLYNWGGTPTDMCGSSITRSNGSCCQNRSHIDLGIDRDTDIDRDKYKIDMNFASLLTALNGVAICQRQQNVSHLWIITLAISQVIFFRNNKLLRIRYDWKHRVETDNIWGDKAWALVHGLPLEGQGPGFQHFHIWTWLLTPRWEVVSIWQENGCECERI